MCVLERGRGHETVITDSILHLKKDPAVLLSGAHGCGDEEDADMPAQSAGSDCIQSDLNLSTQTHTALITLGSVQIEKTKNQGSHV